MELRIFVKGKSREIFNYYLKRFYPRKVKWKSLLIDT